MKPIKKLSDVTIEDFEHLMSKISLNYEDMVGRKAEIKKLYDKAEDDSCYIMIEGGNDEGIQIAIREGEIEMIYDACREYLVKHIWD